MLRRAIVPEGRRFTTALVLLVFLVAALTVFHVLRTLGEVRGALPVILSEQERDIAGLLAETFRLDGLIAIARIDRTPERLAMALEQVVVIERLLSGMRATYELDNLLGAAAVHAVLNPALFDVRNWLEKGVQGLPPDSRLVLTLVSMRVGTALRETELLYKTALATASAILGRQNQRLADLRQAVVAAFVVMAMVALLLVIFVLRGHRTEAALRRSEAMLRESQKMEAVGQLTGGVAHDFNNLLAVIQGNTELLASKVGRDNPKIKAILRASGHGADLTQRLLAFSRQQMLEPKPLDLNLVVAGMIQMLHRTLHEAVEIEVVQEAGIWACEADPGQLESALLNLAINARDAMPEGGKLTITTGNLSFDQNAAAAEGDIEPGEYVMLAVRDTGIGIAPGILGHVFEPFFTTKGVGQGSGLGLSMVFGFAKQSGGLVTIDSAVDLGTEVKLYLPRSEHHRVIVVDHDWSDELEQASGEAILLVEDNEDLRKSVAKSLRSLGYKVFLAGNAKSALARLEEGESVDLLLTDIVLPGGLSGHRLVALAHKRDPGLAVLYMSGFAEIDPSQEVDGGEDSQLLRKPFAIAELAWKLRRALERLPEKVR